MSKNFSFMTLCDKRNIPAGWVMIDTKELEKLRKENISLFDELVVSGIDCFRCVFNCLLVPREAIEDYSGGSLE